MTTSQVYIFSELRKKGIPCPDVKLKSRAQVFIFYECHCLQPLVHAEENLLSNFHYSDVASACTNLYKVYDELFCNGITLGCVLSMYVFAGLLATTFTFPSEAVKIADWVDDYILTRLKPTLIELNRWQYYAPLFCVE